MEGMALMMVPTLVWVVLFQPPKIWASAALHCIAVPPRSTAGRTENSKKYTQRYFVIILAGDVFADTCEVYCESGC